MKPGFWDYVTSAFNARPMGMLVPPNWVGLAAFGMLGVINPGFWALGAGLELAYLFSLTNSRRFRRLVEGEKGLEAQQQRQAELEAQVASLDPAERDRYRALERRCRTILEKQLTDAPPQALQAQAEGLGRLLWIYLRLLTTRHAMERALVESAGPKGDSLEARIARLERQVRSDKIGDDLRRSLEGQIEILRQRLEKHDEARQKLAVLDAELARIEQQVELIRDQAMLAADPEAVSHRIDQIGATLGETQQWVREQRQLLGRVDDLLSEPPPVSLQAPAGEALAQ